MTALDSRSPRPRGSPAADGATRTTVSHRRRRGDRTRTTRFRAPQNLGGWATLVRDLHKDEDQVLRACRPETQRSIRRSLRLGIEISVEDEPAGRAVLAGLKRELARWAPVSPVCPAEIGRISRLWLKNGAGGTAVVARHQGEPLAAALVMKHRGTAHLPMIPSSRRHRELPASRLCSSGSRCDGPSATAVRPSTSRDTAWSCNPATLCGALTNSNALSPWSMQVTSQ